MAAISLLGATAMLNGDQTRRQGASVPDVSVTVSLKVNEQFMRSSGPGTCTHAPRASIYNVPSEMWTVRQEAETRSTQLTLWRPADGKDEMFSFSLSGGKTINISTVRGGTISGSGTVKLKPGGKGGTFTIDAKTRSGEAVAGTIECSAFTPAVAEGG
jgi:hypothetical protein